MVLLEISADNIGEIGWYEGRLKTDGESYVLVTDEAEKEAFIDADFSFEEIWEDVKSGEEVMLKGFLREEEKITGRSEYWIKGVEQAAIVLEEYFSGRRVGISGYDLVFSGKDDYTVEPADEPEGLRENIRAWFPERADEYIQKAEGFRYGF